MSRHLITVEDTFAIVGRGTLVLPHVDLGSLTPIKMRIELRRPDGSRECVDAHAAVETICGRKGSRSGLVLLVDAAKARIPIGTEVWTIDE